ncbi:MAG TPA: sigma-70 family RNA polymerase sigma factor, partial [Solirubrobacteraceae bacterium]|nr:sigma-70 family RNA polymerase sigma factor [Solirubrobacteraceae bacterium]
MALFRAGHDEAFRVIHDRYKQRLFAYTRQMLSSSRPDAEDAMQDIFVRAYVGLRASDRELSLRAWLYRIAHNRCVDELRRPLPPTPEVLSILRAPVHDPTVEAEQRESLRRLIEDVRRLPDQQRSALLMRELGGMPYTDVAAAIGVSVAAVKSLLVRARIGLAQAAEARDTACVEIQEALVLAHDRGVRPSGRARRHMHDCAGCRAFRTQLRGTSRQLAALAPTLGPLGVLAKLLGFGGGATGGAAAAGSGMGTAGATGAAASGGLLAGGIGHVTALLAAAVVTAGGAVELQHTISAGISHPARTRADHAVFSGSAELAPAASAANSSTGSAYAPAITRPSTPATTDARGAPSPSKAQLATGPSVSSTQSSSGGAANAGAVSSGGADATGGTGTATGTDTGLGTTGTDSSSSSTTTGSTATGSGS